MKPVIIHCPTDSEFRKDDWYGTTWLISQSDVPSYVHVQFSTCSPEDQFSKKRGREIANAAQKVMVRKADLIEYVQTAHTGNGLYLVPTIEQIYFAIIKL